MSMESIYNFVYNVAEIGQLVYTFAVDQSCTVASQFQGNSLSIQLLPMLTQTAQLQLQMLLEQLNQNPPQLSSDKDDRTLITTGKKPSTADLYKLLSDRGHRSETYDWIWRKEIPPTQVLPLVGLQRQTKHLNTKDNMIKKKWCTDAGCDLCQQLTRSTTSHCNADTLIGSGISCRYPPSQGHPLQLCSSATRFSNRSIFFLRR